MDETGMAGDMEGSATEGLTNLSEKLSPSITLTRLDAVYPAGLLDMPITAATTVGMEGTAASSIFEVEAAVAIGRSLH